MLLKDTNKKDWPLYITESVHFIAMQHHRSRSSLSYYKQFLSKIPMVSTESRQLPFFLPKILKYKYTKLTLSPMSKPTWKDGHLHKVNKILHLVGCRLQATWIVETWNGKWTMGSVSDRKAKFLNISHPSLNNQKLRISASTKSTKL